MNKIDRGTPDHSATTLCATCRAGVVIRGQRMSDDAIFCRALGANGSAMSVARVTRQVVQCSAYEDSRQPTRWDLEQIAWELTTSPSRKVGFLSPQERANRGAMPPIR